MQNVLSFVSCFLPNEMLHVYRQVSNLEKFNSHAITRKINSLDKFPFENLYLLKKPATRFIKRYYLRLLKRPVTLSRYEVNQILEYSQSIGGGLLHIYQGDVALRSLDLLRLHNGPKVVSFHGADLSDHLSEDYVKLWRYSDFFLCRCEAFKDKLIQMGCPAEKIRLNYTGVPLPQRFKVSDHSDGKIFKILQVCRLIDKKGLDLSIKALKIARDSGVDATLTIAGDGPLSNTLRLLVQDLNLENEIKFLGFLENDALENAYLDAHLFCHPSRITKAGDREGIPNSIAEAMSYGLPVVSTGHSGIPEIVQHNLSGLLVSKECPELIADAIVKLAKRREHLAFLSYQARKRIENKFSIKQCVNDLEAIYTEALSGSK
jgi:colanic acid/amylovoran biosynthesis glycosyltransferase